MKQALVRCASRNELPAPNCWFVPRQPWGWPARRPEGRRRRPGEQPPAIARFDGTPPARPLRSDGFRTGPGRPSRRPTRLPRAASSGRSGARSDPPACRAKGHSHRVTSRGAICRFDGRPSAGWPYATIGLDVEADRRSNQPWLTLGVVGPASLAEQTQGDSQDHAIACTAGLGHAAAQRAPTGPGLPARVATGCGIAGPEFDLADAQAAPRQRLHA